MFKVHPFQFDPESRSGRCDRCGYLESSLIHQSETTPSMIEVLREELTRALKQPALVEWPTKEHPMYLNDQAIEVLRRSARFGKMIEEGIIQPYIKLED